MKIINEAGAEYFIVNGLPPGTYTVVAGNSAGESAPASFFIPAPELTVPATPVVE